jgi:hypothetical protein
MKDYREIKKYILHYENELEKCYYLLNFLESDKDNSKYDIDRIIFITKTVALFTAFFLDTATSIKGFYQSKTSWEVKFYLKAGITCVYESLSKYDKLQNEIRLMITENYSEFSHAYKDILYSVKKFKKEHSYDHIMANFRNNAGAHYDKNFLTYYSTLKRMDSNEKILIVIEFSNILMNIINFYSTIIEKEKNEIF